MIEQRQNGLQFDRPIQIGEGVYWVGFNDTKSRLRCNPYLIVEGKEAVVIDAGSRTDFPAVMMKILQTGVDPSSITALIYDHFDPDLCGGISNFEEIIGRKDLKLISQKACEMLMRHYGATRPLVSIKELDHQFTFGSGRQVQFINIPYAHTQGNFVTFDQKTGILFTSDLFGSMSIEWELFLKLSPKCNQCADYFKCAMGRPYCPVYDILHFHKVLMPSDKALSYALKQIQTVPFTMLAPQHGSIISEPDDIKLIIDRLSSLRGVGIDGVVNEEKA